MCRNLKEDYKPQDLNPMKAQIAKSINDGQYSALEQISYWRDFSDATRRFEFEDKKLEVERFPND